MEYHKAVLYAYIQDAGALTLTLLTWRMWWAPNNASKWQMGFNSAFKGLIFSTCIVLFCFLLYILWIVVSECNMNPWKNHRPCNYFSLIAVLGDVKETSESAWGLLQHWHLLFCFLHSYLINALYHFIFYTILYHKIFYWVLLQWKLQDMHGYSVCCCFIQLCRCGTLLQNWQHFSHDTCTLQRCC